MSRVVKLRHSLPTGIASKVCEIGDEERLNVGSLFRIFSFSSNDKIRKKQKPQTSFYFSPLSLLTSTSL